MTASVITGDCIEAMKEMPESSVDSVVCDPPYGIRFMGKAWDAPGVAETTTREQKLRDKRKWNPSHGLKPSDVKRPVASAATVAGKYDLSLSANQGYQAWCEQWARECLRVLKPGGYLLASGGTRTYHRLACAIEDAGFEIRDRILHLSGGGGAAESFPAEVAWVYGSG